MDPLEAYRQRLEQKKKQKPNPIGIYAAVGGVLLLILVIWAVSRPAGPRTATTGSPTVTADVNLSESRKRQVYASICRYREMLTSRGGTARRAYEIVAEQNKVSVNAIQQIEAEGMSKHWPRE